jgi:hypothetical protein
MKRRRETSITVRISKMEKQQIEEWAEASGRTVGAWVRRKLGVGRHLMMRPQTGAVADPGLGPSSDNGH